MSLGAQWSKQSTEHALCVPLSLVPLPDPLQRLQCVPVSWAGPEGEQGRSLCLVRRPDSQPPAPSRVCVLGFYSGPVPCWLPGGCVFMCHTHVYHQGGVFPPQRGCEVGWKDLGCAGGPASSIDYNTPLTQSPTQLQTQKFNNPSISFQFQNPCEKTWPIGLQ